MVSFHIKKGCTNIEGEEDQETQGANQTAICNCQPLAKENQFSPRNIIRYTNYSSGKVHDQEQLAKTKGIQQYFYGLFILFYFVSAFFPPVLFIFCLFALILFLNFLLLLVLLCFCFVKGKEKQSWVRREVGRIWEEQGERKMRSKYFV